MKTGIISLSIILIFVLSQITVAQGLWRSKRISLNTGLTDNAEAHVTISPTEVVTNSFQSSSVSSSFGFGAHIDEGLWGDFRMEFRGLQAETKIGHPGKVSNHAVGLLPVMIGLRYYLFHDMDTGFQPFIFASGGPIIGMEASNEVGVYIENEAHTETTLGGKYGGGVDFMLTNWLAIEVAGGYLSMREFKEPLNGSTKFNGWDVIFGISLFLGEQ